MAATVEELIKAFQLAPHPEGGFFKESYQAEEKIGKRSCCTAIYFLLPKGAKSRLHRLRSDELWHFYLGGPLTIVEITEEGRVVETVLAPISERDKACSIS